MTRRFGADWAAFLSFGGVVLLSVLASHCSWAIDDELDGLKLDHQPRDAGTLEAGDSDGVVDCADERALDATPDATLDEHEKDDAGPTDGEARDDSADDHRPSDDSADDHKNCDGNADQNRDSNAGIGRDAADHDAASDGVPRDQEVTAERDAATSEQDASSQEAGTSAVRTQYRALVVVYAPRVLRSMGYPTDEGGLWRAPEEEARAFANTLSSVSAGKVQIEIAQVITHEGFVPWTNRADEPTDDSYPAQWSSVSGRCRDGAQAPPNIVDYSRIVQTDRIDRLVDSESVDLVLLFGPPCSGQARAVLVGPKAHTIDGVLPIALDSRRTFPIVWGSMLTSQSGDLLENFSHYVGERMERVAAGALGGPPWPRVLEIVRWSSFDLGNRQPMAKQVNSWERFLLSATMGSTPEQTSPSHAGVGSVQYPPTSVAANDWGRVRLDRPFDEQFAASRPAWSGTGEYTARNAEFARALAVHAPGGAQGNEPTGRYLLGADFEYTATIALSAPEQNDAGPAARAGLLLRIEHDGPGLDETRGYFAGIDAASSTAFLVELGMSRTVLASAPLAIRPGSAHELRVVAEGPRMRLYLDGATDASVQTDRAKASSGAFGLAVEQGSARFSSLCILGRSDSNDAELWYDYPQFRRGPRRLTPEAWGENRIGWLAWWLEHLPKRAGVHSEMALSDGAPQDGILNSWWPYAMEPGRFDGDPVSSAIAFPADDTTAPEAPEGVLVFVKDGVGRLAWRPAKDDGGVTRYEVYRDGALVAETVATTFRDGEAHGSPLRHVYSVRARDASGNVSAEGAASWACGDVDEDGTITASDAARIETAIGAQGSPGSPWQSRADINQDGQITLHDAALVRAFLSGQTVDLCVRRLLGDANRDGVLDNNDACAMARYSAGVGTLDATALVVSDLNSDGRVDIRDATLAAKWVGGEDAGNLACVSYVKPFETK